MLFCHRDASNHSETWSQARSGRLRSCQLSWWRPNLRRFSFRVASFASLNLCQAPPTPSTCRQTTSGVLEGLKTSQLRSVRRGLRGRMRLPVSWEIRYPGVHSRPRIATGRDYRAKEKLPIILPTKQTSEVESPCSLSSRPTQRRSKQVRSRGEEHLEAWNLMNRRVRRTHKLSTFQILKIQKYFQRNQVHLARGHRKKWMVKGRLHSQVDGKDQGLIWTLCLSFPPEWLRCSKPAMSNPPPAGRMKPSKRFCAAQFRFSQ